MRFANFSRSLSPRKHFLAGRLSGLHHIVERTDGIRQIVQEILPGHPSPDTLDGVGETKQRRFTTVALAARPSAGRIEKSMSPKTLQEVERAIGALTPQEVQELYVWLEQHFPQPLDARLLSDLSAGSLDTAIQRALDDEKNGRLRPL
jgi:hypothetical protein